MTRSSPRRSSDTRATPIKQDKEEVKISRRKIGANADTDSSVEKRSKKRKLTKPRQTSKAQRKWANLCRRKPDVVQDRELERGLIRTATRGVVQLFNAIREHQSGVGKAVAEIGATTTKVEKKVKAINKQSRFLDLVTKNAGTKRLKLENADSQDLKSRLVKKEEVTVEADDDDDATWDVLRDDFLSNSVTD